MCIRDSCLTCAVPGYYSHCWSVTTSTIVKRRWHVLRMLSGVYIPSTWALALALAFRVWLNVADVNRQWVPGGGTCDSERTVSKSCSCPSHNEISTCWWPETLVAAATAQISPIPLILWYYRYFRGLIDWLIDWFLTSPNRVGCQPSAAPCCHTLRGNDVLIINFIRYFLSCTSLWVAL